MIRRVVFTALAVAALVGPRALAAQANDAAAKPTAQVPAVDRELEAFAKLQFALNLARDEYNATLSKAHEVAAKDEAVAAFDKRKAELFASMGTTEEAYSRELYRVSSDAALRAAFDRLMKELAAK